MSRLKLGIAAVFAGVALSGAVASASSLPVTAVLNNLGDNPAGVQPGTNSLTVQFASTSMANAFVGQLNWHATGPAGNLTTGLNANLNSILGPNQSFSSYCIEGLQDVVFGQTETWNLGVVTMDTAPTPGTAMGTVKAGEISELWNRFHDTVGLDNEKAAAFQLAIWEITNDGIATLGGETAGNFGNGTFQAMGDNTAINQAVTWMNAIGSGTAFTNTYSLFALSDAGIQDQIFGVPNGGALPGVPLPEALPAGLVLLSGLGMFKFWRRRA